jgi:hypothetical protein
LHVLAQSLKRAATMLAGEEELVLESYGEKAPTHVRLVGQHGWVMMDTEEVKVPDLTSVLNATREGATAISAVIERAPLMRYLKMARVKKKDKDTLIPICFDATRAGEPMLLYLSEAAAEISSDPVHAGPVVEEGTFFAVLDIAQFTDIVNTIDTPEVQLRFFGERVPMRINGYGKPERFHVIAPLQKIEPRQVAAPAMPVEVAEAA